MNLDCAAAVTQERLRGLWGTMVLLQGTVNMAPSSLWPAHLLRLSRPTLGLLLLLLSRFSCVRLCATP